MHIDKRILPLTIFCILGVCAAAGAYPVVGAMKKTFFVSNIRSANVATIIRARNGAALYKLQCHSAGYTGDVNFDYSGDFECRLSSIGRIDTYSTLLTEDVNQSRDWESRGRFFAKSLRGACAHISQFGSRRSFALRGMTLILQITNTKFMDDGALHSLELTVIVEPNKDAKRKIAEIVPVPTTGVPDNCGLNTYFANPDSS